MTRRCPKCSGSGTVDTTIKGKITTIDCPQCKGSGKICGIGSGKEITRGGKVRWFHVCVLAAGHGGPHECYCHFKWHGNWVEDPEGAAV